MGGLEKREQDAFMSVIEFKLIYLVTQCWQTCDTQRKRQVDWKTSKRYAKMASALLFTSLASKQQ